MNVRRRFLWFLIALIMFFSFGGSCWAWTGTTDVPVTGTWSYSDSTGASGTLVINTDGDGQEVSTYGTYNCTWSRTGSTLYLNFGSNLPFTITLNSGNTIVYATYVAGGVTTTITMNPAPAGYSGGGTTTGGTTTGGTTTGGTTTGGYDPVGTSTDPADINDGGPDGNGDPNAVAPDVTTGSTPCTTMQADAMNLAGMFVVLNTVDVYNWTGGTSPVPVTLTLPWTGLGTTAPSMTFDLMFSGSDPCSVAISTLAGICKGLIWLMSMIWWLVHMSKVFRQY